MISEVISDVNKWTPKLEEPPKECIDFIDNGDYCKANKCIDKAIDQSTNMRYSNQMHYYKAMCMMNLGIYSDAIKYFLEAQKTPFTGNGIKDKLKDCYDRWQQDWCCPFCGKLDPTKQLSLPQRIDDVELEVGPGSSDLIPLPIEISAKFTVEQQPEKIYHYKCKGCEPTRNYYDISTVDIDNILQSIEYLDPVK